MDGLNTRPVADVLAHLFRQAENADRALLESATQSETSLQQLISDVIEAEKADLRGLCHGQANNFLAISPEFGQFLYMCARARGAKRIVEFGTSMGISAIHLAAALHDMGSGQLITTEIVPSKAGRARENIAAAGLSEFVDVRIGDARETLRDITGHVDMVLLDGAFTLYLDLLKLRFVAAAFSFRNYKPLQFRVGLRLTDHFSNDRVYTSLRW